MLNLDSKLIPNLREVRLRLGIALNVPTESDTSAKFARLREALPYSNTATIWNTFVTGCWVKIAIAIVRAVLGVYG